MDILLDMVRWLPAGGRTPLRMDSVSEAGEQGAWAGSLRLESAAFPHRAPSMSETTGTLKRADKVTPVSVSFLFPTSNAQRGQMRLNTKLYARMHVRFLKVSPGPGSGVFPQTARLDAVGCVGGLLCVPPFICNPATVPLNDQLNKSH